MPCLSLLLAYHSSNGDQKKEFHVIPEDMGFIETWLCGEISVHCVCMRSTSTISVYHTTPEQ